MTADYNSCLNAAVTIIQNLQVLASPSQVVGQLIKDESALSQYPSIIASVQDEEETFDYLTSTQKLQKFPIDVLYVDRLDSPGATIVPAWTLVRQTITDAFPNKPQPSYPSNVIGVTVEPRKVSDTETKPYQRVLGNIRLWFQTVRPV